MSYDDHQPPTATNNVSAEKGLFCLVEFSYKLEYNLHKRESLEFFLRFSDINAISIEAGSRVVEFCAPYSLDTQNSTRAPYIILLCSF